MNLNARAERLLACLLERAEERRVTRIEIEGGGLVLDCGIEAPGGVLTGIDLARLCMADLATLSLVPGVLGDRSCPLVQVVTDHPAASCLASQYAGWQITEGSFIAMGSGPMRAAYGGEALFDTIGFREDAESVVGVLEGRKRPTPEVVSKIAQACRVPQEKVTLLIAPTASLAGGVQIVARSVETALHKLAELGFDLSRVISAFGSAPLPPVAENDLKAIGRTNDAILYGARVVLYVNGDDESLHALGPKVPSSSSRDFGEPFSAIFQRYNHDFYAVDPHLFSPAEVTFQNLETGQTCTFGRLAPEILVNSFALYK